jgi:FAD/FMN-containing dehydrogenase
MINLDYTELTGEIITRESFNYEEERACWNRAIKKYPKVIINCSNNADISNAIAWAKKNSLEIRIRSGRHHYEGYSTGDDVVVIDVNKMTNIEIDEKASLVKIQGGVSNREIYEALGKANYPFPGGGCPTVGVTGLVLGGGWGYSCRILGLSADSLLQIELIDYKGELIIASENINEDLFWACRGSGGGNFGVVTSMTFKLPAKQNIATLIDIDYANINLDQIKSIFDLWIELFKDLDRRMNLKMAIYNSKINGKGVHITGVFYGSENEASSILSKFKSVLPYRVFDLKCTSILEVNRIIQDSHPPYEKYKSSGRFVFNNYDSSMVKKIIKLVNERAEGSIYTAVSLYGLGGAVMDKDKEDTAFFYRDAKFIMGFQSVWEDDVHAKTNIDFVKNNISFIKSITTGAYINFPCGELENYEEEYYGENYKELRKIKIKYDPSNVFNFPQGIKTIL